MLGMEQTPLILSLQAKIAALEKEVKKLHQTLRSFENVAPPPLQRQSSQPTPKIKKQELPPKLKRRHSTNSLHDSQAKHRRTSTSQIARGPPVYVKTENYLLDKRKWNGSLERSPPCFQRNS